MLPTRHNAQRLINRVMQCLVNLKTWPPSFNTSEYAVKTASALPDEPYCFAILMLSA